MACCKLGLLRQGTWQLVHLVFKVHHFRHCHDQLVILLGRHRLEQVLQLVFVGRSSVRKGERIAVILTCFLLLSHAQTVYLLVVLRGAALGTLVTALILRHAGELCFEIVQFILRKGQIMLFIILSRRNVVESDTLILVKILAVVMQLGLLNGGLDLLVEPVLDFGQDSELLLLLPFLDWCHSSVMTQTGGCSLLPVHLCCCCCILLLHDHAV